ncbi:tail protein [Carboxydothermus islandicus]|uniref:Tail protein n=1 Tax=Carboxydothermus islandicus TaxID=661089 RepID=A0A1L8D0Y1_9THEO|nr:phage tail protein I [Carboxydothermus islandicus]GAV24818.1 tail protein [Carboxydothermus islandicus]
MINIREIRLIDILPPNIAQDSKVRSAAEALDRELQAVTSAIDQCLLLSRIEELPESVVDLLAWQFHVDFYVAGLSIEQKRILLKNSLIWHMRKGTPAAVEEIIMALFDDGKVVEWWEYGGEPYKFKIVTNNAAVTKEKALEFIKLLESVKNARSWLEKIEITITDSVPFYFAGVVYMGDRLELRQVV